MKKVYVIIGLIAAFSIFILGTKIVLADESFGLKATAEAAKLDTYGDDVPTIAGNIIGTLLSMISVLFFVLVLYGGILWMTARGSSETTEKALNTIIAATIGIIIVIGAYALTNFVFKLGRNTGGNQSNNSGDIGGNDTALKWCLNGSTCNQGSGGGCSQLFDTEALCNAAIGGKWCLSEDKKTCNQGSGGGCPNPLFDTEAACIAAKT
ncbi:MAG TPA: hypothetical protein PK295_02355 [Candidatus Magasanikbacteria bacterium]|nr:hypothetical protein [Candidatus Magasanikbacteria bacterium]